MLGCGRSGVDWVGVSLAIVRIAQWTPSVQTRHGKVEYVDNDLRGHGTSLKDETAVPDHRSLMLARAG